MWSHFPQSKTFRVLCLWTSIRQSLILFNFHFYFDTWGMFEQRQRGLKRKGRGGGNRRRGPGWGHGHTCLGLLVIYCPELRRQSAEFKEICNEKFLIPSLKAFVKPRLLPPSLRHAIDTFIRQIKSLDMAMSSGSKLLVANLNVFSLEAVEPCSSHGTCCVLGNKHAEHNSGSLVAKKSALS